MREMVNKDTQNLVSNSFLLDDDLRYAIYISFNYHTVDSLLPWMIYMLNIIWLLVQYTVLHRGFVDGYPSNRLCRCGPPGIASALSGSKVSTQAAGSTAACPIE